MAFVPALQATGREMLDFLGQSGRSITSRGERLRSTLVVLEIATALVLLTGAGLMLKSFLRMRAVNPGFRPENILAMTVDLPESVYQNATAIQAFHAHTGEALQRTWGNGVGRGQLSSIHSVVGAGRANSRTAGGVFRAVSWWISRGKRGLFSGAGDPIIAGASSRKRQWRGAGCRDHQRVGMALGPAKVDPVGKRITLEDNGRSRGTGLPSPARSTMSARIA